MKYISKSESKFFNVLTILLEITFEIILLPFHIVVAIRNVIKELKR